MNLYDLIISLDLSPKKTSFTNGGEYHCACPSCGGKDRFMFWPLSNRYWCRQCKKKGNAIQFSIDFLGLSLREACIKLKYYPSILTTIKPSLPTIKPSKDASNAWIKKAKAFIEIAIHRLDIDTAAMNFIKKRGLSKETIKKYFIGWNPIKIFSPRKEWGLEEVENKKDLCIPEGIIIPLFNNNEISRIKIRKSDSEHNNVYGKYHEIPSISNMLPIYGDLFLSTAMIVESELDAMLIIQEATELCCCVALGGAQKRPNDFLFQFLNKKQLILFALDFDAAGKKEFPYWKNIFPNLQPWPTPEEKSPGDYYSKGGSLHHWIKSGINYYLNK